MSTRKKTRKGSSSRRHDAPADEWKQFTSPDGHPYYYNAATKESRWELPVEETARVKHRRPKEKSLNEEKSLDEEPKKDKKKRPEPDVKATPKPKNAMFQKLQASLEGRLNGPMMGMKGPPPMLQIRREDEVATEQEEAKTPSLEEQYEAETAGMSAAERLRFLRKKRQENMMAKKESIAGDDFMAEVANNMKKKGVTVKPKQKERSSEKRSSWKEQEQAEEERKRQQMQDELEVKEREAAKEREQQAAKEREQRREHERAEQLEIERRHEQERKQHQESMKQEQEEHVKESNGDRDSLRNIDKGDRTSTTDPDVKSRSSVSDSTTVQDEEDSDPSSPERVNRRRSRSRASKHSGSVQRNSINPADSVEDDHPQADNGHHVDSVIAADSVQDEKQRTREERLARKLREKELAAAKPNSVASESPRRKSRSSLSGINEESRTRSTSSIKAEEEARAREKQLRRERRRMAKMEAALAAQSLDNNSDQGDVQRECTPDKCSEQQPDNRNGSTPRSHHAGGDTMSGQPAVGQPPFSGGMYPPYPYMMPPPPPSPYGYYYPYMQPPPMSIPMYPPGMVSPGYQLIPPTPPPSANGVAVPSALVPYGTESTLANAYGFGGMYGQQSAPELSRCDCCKGIGVGLVEKNGVCAHCNRLRLAFIVDSAQMRQRCSVCGGWGFQLLQANGMCEHCTRRTAQKSQAKLITEARRRSIPASVTTAVVEAAPLRRNSTMNLPKNDGLDDIDWDKSSSDDSDWDD